MFITLSQCKGCMFYCTIICALYTTKYGKKTDIEYSNWSSF